MPGCFAGTTLNLWRHPLPLNFASIARLVLTVSSFASVSTSFQRTTAPWATSFFSLTRCANPIGSAPAARLAAAGINLPHTV